MRDSGIFACIAQRGVEVSRIAFGYFGGAIFAGPMLYACLFFIDCATLGSALRKKLISSCCVGLYESRRGVGPRTCRLHACAVRTPNYDHET